MDRFKNIENMRKLASVATAILAFVAGLWCDALLRRTESERVSPTERVKIIGVKCTGLAERIDLTLGLWKHGNPKKITSDYWAEFLPIAFDIEKLGIETPDRGIETKNDLEVISHYLKFVGELLAGGHLKEAKRTAHNLSGNPSHRGIRFLPRWLQEPVQKMWLKIRPG